MATSPYLFRVLAKPTKVDLDTWEEWTSLENIASLIETKAATRVGLYQAFNDYPLATKTPNTVDQTKLHSVNVTHSDVEPPTEKRCLVMCQTEDPDVLKKQFLKNVSQGSDIFSGKEPISCAEWDSRVYKLIQDFDPKGAGYNDDDDYNKFYRDEHLYMLSKVPGYRRSQRYELVSSENLSLSSVPRFMAIHEFETLETTDGPELREADASPNTHRVIGNAEFVNVRGFKLVQTLSGIKQ
ncbi:hypothetical protein LTR10_022715 [Elasticomyces elasticus]|uniref:EthD domain-containing protein n=1 Tax=Exophiala sideris TaxID=1016849 RepID=A0ABR0IXF8_9EURO|nr:hypothetical protein LTR10_022715 [Elasticomyces elasticus]KAK5021497.1 hypothetical protein LTS07_011006 [Exophiala sideris]KAK5024480.1 hypothetical protein LTR13_010840 [Exophiala sideris]KAK5049629.1 hypothetical protein LTR69_011030 [Exophiala sideris]KAK5176576.1 hypothetical protein LTR44_010861 [Eurotiomycetes sp. CCFEE 6388]